jgi:hypothetical protein
MLDFYKRKKKEKAERRLNDYIAFNEYLIDYYSMYPRTMYIRKPQVDFESDRKISYCYSESVWRSFERYGVSRELWDKQVETAHNAIKEYIELLCREEDKKKQIEEEREIKLVKKAILELKDEGKL